MREPIFIESYENDRFKVWQSLLKPKGIKKEGLCIASGVKIINEIIENSPDSIDAVIFPPNAKWEQLARLLPSNNDRTLFQLSKDRFDEIDLYGTHSTLLVVKTPTLPQWDDDDEIRGKEVLLPLGDPSNLGAVIRGCAAFDIQKIVLLEEAAHPFHPKTIRASSGYVFRAPLFFGPSIHDLVQQPMALDAGGTPLSDFEWPEAGRLVIGEEGPGLPKDFNADRISIPMSAGLDSLNAAVAAGIALYEWSKR